MGSMSPKKKARRVSSTIFVVALVAFALTLLSIFGPTFYIVDQHSSLAMDVRKGRHMRVVNVMALEHEEMFQSTIKSCLPSEKQNCKTFMPTPKEGEESVQRVAVITPPGTVATSLLKKVEQIAFEHNHLESKSEPEIDLIPRSNVPPYGYGKTHGLTKIIRVIPQPLVLEVTDALQIMLGPGESYRKITLDDLKAALRIILRFHCRLSHVAAHTAILSVPFMDLVTNPATVHGQLTSFLVPNDLGSSPKERDDVVAEITGDDDQGEEFDAEESYGSQILTFIQSMTSSDVYKILDQVLVEEMEKTKNLTVWPCPSFWAAGDEPDVLKLSPVVQRIAEAISPDCNDPMASCFVQRDKCEAQKDGVCNESAKR